MVSRSVGGSAICRHLGPPARGLEHSLLRQRGQHLGHEQRIARRAGHPGQQPLARCRAHRVRDQAPLPPPRPRPPRLRCRAPAALPATAASRSSSADARRRPEARDEGHREIGSARRPARPASAGWTRSAHCRSSTPITSGPASASSSTRSASASTDPEPQARVAGHRDRIALPAVPPDNSSPMAARRGSVADLVQPNTPVIRPNGRMPSSSSARPAATCMPRPPRVLAAPRPAAVSCRCRPRPR